jgi:hypothetical protein
MAAKSTFAAASLAFIAFASGTFLGSVPTYKIDPDSVGGILTSLAAFSSGSIKDDELKKMEKDIEELVMTGSDPATKVAVKQLSSFVNMVLIPSRLKAEKRDQARLDAKMKTLKNCGLDQQPKLDADKKEQLNTADNHLSDFKDSQAKHAHCVNVLEGRRLVKQAYCNSIDEDQVCHCHSGLVKAFGQRNQDCDKTPAIGAEDEKCCDAYYEHEVQFSECGKVHMDAELAAKQHGIIMTKMCKMYSRCYEFHSKDYQVVEKLVRTHQKQRSWDVVFRIQCLVESFKGGKVSKTVADGCKAKHWSKGIVRIDNRHGEPKGILYPPLPAKERCLMDALHA